MLHPQHVCIFSSSTGVSHHPTAASFLRSVSRWLHHCVNIINYSLLQKQPLTRHRHWKCFVLEQNVIVRPVTAAIGSGDLLDDLSAVSSAVNILNLCSPWCSCLGATRLLSPSLLILSLLFRCAYPQKSSCSSRLDNHLYPSILQALTCLLPSEISTEGSPFALLLGFPNLQTYRTPIPKKTSIFSPRSTQTLVQVDFTTPSCRSKTYRSYRLLPSPSSHPLFLYLRTTPKYKLPPSSLLN